MVKLQPLPGLELSAYVIELLAKYEITTVRDFLKTDIMEISKKTNLSSERVQQIQNKLREMHCPARLNLLQQYKNLKKQIYGFGIESLDNLLGHQTLYNGSIHEIFGPGAIGKTRFCHSVILNFVRTWKVEALYIDTKQDFSGTCLYQIIRQRNIAKKECGQIMQRIKVERTWTLEGIFDILKQLDEKLKCGAEVVAAIKFVIIDSLPAVWFTLNGDDERLERKYLLCKIANLLHKLAKEHSIAFLLVNLAVEEEENIIENADMPEINTNAIQLSLESNANALPLKPVLGRYWSSIPHTRLLMKMPDDADEYATERVIEITRNSYGPSGGSCLVHITDAGVVN